MFENLMATHTADLDAAHTVAIQERESREAGDVLVSSLLVLHWRIVNRYPFRTTSYRTLRVRSKYLNKSTARKMKK